MNENSPIFPFCGPKRRFRRRGAQVLEGILVIPVLVLAVVAMIQFTAVSTVQQAVESAADEVAREMAKAEVRGGDFAADGPAITKSVVDDVLGVHGLTVSNPLAADASGVRVTVEDGDNAANNFSIGDSTQTAVTDAQTVLQPGEVRVTVVLSFDPAGGNPDPVPDVLSYVGLTFSNRFYRVRTIARKE